jgi:hypothetical protein
MKAIRADYDAEKDRVAVREGAGDEDWPAVCARYHDDVQRVRDAGEVPPYTGLYACFDDDNRPHHYLVQEDADLHRLRRKTFLRNLGREA